MFFLFLNLVCVLKFFLSSLTNIDMKLSKNISLHLGEEFKFSTNKNNAFEMKFCVITYRCKFKVSLTSLSPLENKHFSLSDVNMYA